ncbi:GGDEF domain-containing protein [Rahnella sp. PCH160]|uniref:GGDEF domain-containing protein n=1 Tax=Rahnella sp. PCH160 TaxID=3447928 RepID=UPI0039FC6080
MHTLLLPMITTSFHIISVVYFALSIPSLYLMAHKKVDSRICQIGIGIFSGLIANYIYKNTLLSSDALLGLTLCPIVLVSLIFGPYALFFGGLTHLLRVIGREKFYLSLIDVDFFKVVNDTYGHLTGDKVLVEIAALIGGNIRSSDYLGRFGGEEFMLIIDAPDKKTAESTLERLLRAVRCNEFVNFEGDTTLSLTISAGVALCEKNCMPDTVINSADTALYKAKEGGRDRVEFGVVRSSGER